MTANVDYKLNKHRVRKAKANAFAERLRCVIHDMKARELNQRAMVDELNQLGIKAPRGGEWTLIQLQRILARLRPPG